MLENLNTLIFKLKLCKGISNLGILKVIQFMIKNETHQLSKFDIIQLAEITKSQNYFFASWDYWCEQEEKFLMLEQAHQYLTILDKRYPDYLRQIYNAPAILFYEGDIQLLQSKCFAFVGARKASVYGGKIAKEFVTEMVNKQYTIVSGLARGIDGISHQTAIQKEGRTIAVIGTGLDRTYPKEMSILQNRLKKDQLVITEFVNGTGPQRHHFPLRNRIIAGLSRGICVIEARKRSGSLITAQAALEYGRQVYTVPSNIYAESFLGSHSLIQEGAACVFTAAEILNDLGDF